MFLEVKLRSQSRENHLPPPPLDDSFVHIPGCILVVCLLPRAALFVEEGGARARPAGARDGHFARRRRRQARRS